MLELLNRVARCNLTLAQICAFKHRFFNRFGQIVVKLIDLTNPGAEVLACGQHIFHFSVVIQAALGDIDRQKLPGAQRAFFFYIGLINRDHAGFRPRDEQAVTCHHVAHGP